ncbi:alpha/beta fold hydrolase [Candidatus Methylomicrobium oryzae]|uniref:alpha/beta fold hydrolase n=1 Tax=Candidatus Methylomicrobium oryzae TaxID=2802053 RepID=UPI001A5452B5|nr:alpha/beta fold hydrolase [Methylomicrobium sp. RS1]
MPTPTMYWICEVLGAREIVLVGHSLGSMIAALAANKNPSVVAGGEAPRYLNAVRAVGYAEERSVLSS